VSPSASARPAGRLFFPQREVLQIDGETFSPGVKRKVVLAAVETRSYQRAEKVLQVVGEVEISGRHVGRMAQACGTYLHEQQQQRVAAHQAHELPVEVKNVPELAVVEMDGGRIHTRESGQGPGTHQPAWKETKNALLMRMSSPTHPDDPCPELPDSLQNRNRIRQLVLEMSGSAAGVEEVEETEPGPDSRQQYKGPLRLMRTCLSSLEEVHTFGRSMATEAHRKGFYQASRQAFVADGMACNWGVWKRHFPTFVPIVDFLHAISYVYQAAVAVGGGAQNDGADFGWGQCLEWIRALWQGRVGDVIEELTEWLTIQPSSDSELAEDDPRKIVQASLTYLTNNRTRMNYPAYRREGLPITSSLMESLVKEINWRVKGTEKFWNNPTGATAILALKAAALSEDNRLESVI